MGTRAMKSPAGRCRGIGVSLTPEDEAYLQSYHGTWADAIRAVIQESRFWRKHIEQKPIYEELIPSVPGVSKAYLLAGGEDHG